eukprot:TRINITY_DN11665_c0_g1_i1.p1 TRINITY_DN11665_c0_g1~~TRINITY_DN11665_c0_g1_i1.p1  ORF type:complete len:156 (-),score=31.32 TRINITY_DN11665_c0_g1_i1:52-471(-)
MADQQHLLSSTTTTEYPPQHGAPPPGHQDLPPGHTGPGYTPQAGSYQQVPLEYHQQVVHQVAALSHFPATQYTCPHCTQVVTTTVNRVTGNMTYLAAAGLFFFGCILGCCLIPFFMDDMKDSVHSCPNCHQVVGVVRRM